MVMHAHTRSSDNFVSVKNRPMSSVQIVFVRNKTLRVDIGSQLSLSAPYFIPNLNVRGTNSPPVMSLGLWSEI
jgi:hypothetical protein